MSNNDNISSCLNWLDCVSPSQLATFANLAALVIAKGKSADELNVLGNFIVGVGSLLLTIAAQEQTLQSNQDKLKQLADLKKQVKELEDSLCR